MLIAAWLGSGIAGRSLGELEPFLPPNVGALEPLLGAGNRDVPLTLEWRLNDYSAALAVARQQHRRVLIDFTGYTCTNCRWMEANMFTRPEVKAALNRFVLSRLFTDGEGEIYDRQQAFQQSQFKTVALPFYAIVESDGRTVSTFAGLTRDAVLFTDFLTRNSAPVTASAVGRW